MLFNSIDFMIFMPIVFIFYWALPHKLRWIVLLISSYWFYMSWNPKYIILIFGTTFISYISAIIIQKNKNDSKKKATLIASIVVLLLVLFFFKYFNFMSESVAHLLSMFTLKVNPITVKLLLPVGISFYTFQTLSYIIDVYKGKVEAEYHFGKFATFISFFPQLVAGPIERTENLLPQIKNEHKFNYYQATYGIKLMTWGFFKKIVIADNVAYFTGRVFVSPENYYGFSLVMAVILFSFQIYCDFSGYSDIAIGTAKLMGIDLTKNFDSPYFSKSIKEFWSRWHISLSSWFKDYVYIPIGGNRLGNIRRDVNLLVTFLFSGLWHGANWTFVVWGGLHGVAQIIENKLNLSMKKSQDIISVVKIIIVFLFVSFAWIFFASENIGDAIYIITHMTDGILNPVDYLLNGLHSMYVGKAWLISMFICLSLLLLHDFLALKSDCIEIISKKNIVIRHAIYLLILCIIMLFKSNETAEFVYFQF